MYCESLGGQSTNIKSKQPVVDDRASSEVLLQRSAYLLTIIFYMSMLSNTDGLHQNKVSQCAVEKSEVE